MKKITFNWNSKKNIIFTFTILLTVLVTISSCKKDDTTSEGNLKLNISGLENLGPNYVYENWIMVNGSPVTGGRFTVNDAGEMSQTSFSVSTSDLSSATAFILTIEPAKNDDPAPSSIHILAGDFDGNAGKLSIADSRAIGTDFASAMGNYILATPTDNDTTNENSGVWFLDISSGSPAAGLTLPGLPSGWTYEGWVVVDGVPVSTGTFTKATGSDGFKGHSGANPAPPFPGEDFLVNAPNGLTFPTDVRGGKVVISVEPVPDNSTAPFLLKPLAHDVPASAAVHSVLKMNQNLGSAPTGTFSR